MENINDKYIYLEMLYKEYLTKKGFKEIDLFPSDWYGIKNYELKIKILTEAINQKQPIKNITSYQELISCIKTK